MFQVNNFLLILIFLSLDFLFKPLESIIIITVYFFSRFIYKLIKKIKIVIEEFIEFIFLIIFYLIDLLPINDSFRLLFMLSAMYIFLELSIRKDSIFFNLPIKLVNDRIKYFMKYRLVLLNNLLLSLIIILIPLSVYVPDYMFAFSLVYGTIAMYLLFKKFEYVEKLIHKIFFFNDEMIPIIEENDQLIFNCSRKLAHRYAFPHPTVHLLLVKGNKVLLQKRKKNRRANPGLWDSSVGGHVKSEQKIEEALILEAKEELDLELKEFVFLNKYVINQDGNIEYIYLFKSTYKDDILKPCQSEIDEVKWWTIDSIQKEDENLFTEHFLKNELKYV